MTEFAANTKTDQAAVAGAGRSLTRRQALGAAGVAVGTVAGAQALGLAGAALADEAGAAEGAPEGVGTRYTRYANPDQIGVVQDAASEEDVDVVVAGAGMAGLVCAMLVAEQAPDAKVVLLEAQSACGGGANFAEQADMPAAGMGRDEANQYGEQAAADSIYVKDASLIAELHYELGRNSAWMFGKHAVPLKIRNFARLKQSLDDGGAIRIQPIASYDGGSGDKTVQRFVDEIETEDAYRNVEIRTETRATALLLADERTVTGVQALGADGAYTNLNAKAVVLACGGMSNNLDLLQNYSNQALSHCVSVEQHHYGDAMLLAEQTAHGRCMTIALSSMMAYVDGFHYQSWLGIAAGENPSALFVNETGGRFCNEDMSHVQSNLNTNSVVDYSKVVEGQGAVWSIMGQGLFGYYKENGLFSRSGFYGKGQDERPFDLDAEVEEYADNPNFVTADTIEELAEKIDVPADALAATVERYDADAQAGEDTAYAKDPKYLIPLGDAPYYAFKLSSLIVNTNAGIRVNSDCQVIDQAHKAVKGLYAAGIDISGFVTDVYEVGNCQCVSIWSGSKAARTLVEQELGGTVADDWYGDAEWQADQLPEFSNWDEYEEYLAGLEDEGQEGAGEAAAK